MRGSEYLAAALDGRVTQPLDLENDLEGLTQEKMVENFANTSLEVMLNGMYHDGFVEDYSEHHAQLLAVVDESLEIHRLSTQKIREDRPTRPKQGLNSKTIKPPDVFGGSDLEPDILKNFIRQTIETTRAKVQLASTFMLARALRRTHDQSVQRQGKKPPNYKGMLADTLGAHKAYLADILGGYAFYITASQDERGRVFEVSTASRDATMPLPGWLRNTTHWTDEISYIVGAGSLEFGAYVAAIEWARQSKGKLLPVFAPNTMRGGPIKDPNNNPHANILLCDLSQDRIIPIQVTNHDIGSVRHKYLDKMQFIGPTSLGLTVLEGGMRTLLDRQGRPYTTSTSTTTFGTHLVRFWRNNAKGNSSMRKTPEIEAAHNIANATFDLMTK